LSSVWKKSVSSASRRSGMFASTQRTTASVCRRSVADTTGDTNWRLIMFAGPSKVAARSYVVLSVS
jgi:hypothetical protein